MNPQPAKAENLKKNLKAKPPSFASCVFLWVEWDDLILILDGKMRRFDAYVKAMSCLNHIFDKRKAQDVL